MVLPIAPRAGSALNDHWTTNFERVFLTKNKDRALFLVYLIVAIAIRTSLHSLNKGNPLFCIGAQAHDGNKGRRCRAGTFKEIASSIIGEGPIKSK